VRTARHRPVHVGCSGWNYASWKDEFYGGLPASKWLAHYAQSFDTVEVNNTFYRLPPPQTVDEWAEQAPKGFVYATKLGQYGSHRKKLADPQAWLGNHLDRVQRLGPHRGPCLVQLPPHWRRDTGRLDDFLAAAPRSERWAVELRDPSWLHDDVLAVLERHHAALCIHDLLPDHPWERTAAWTYVRFHGPHAPASPYQGRYTGWRLRRPAQRLEAWLADGTDVFAYFNNDQGAAAVHDARWLADLLSAG
jgi:uncharacterized protein YecE (DUF72 family)